MVTFIQRVCEWCRFAMLCAAHTPMLGGADQEHQEVDMILSWQVGVTAVGKTTVSTTLGRAFSKMKVDECPGGFEKVSMMKMFSVAYCTEQFFIS
jgi:hypothetical protein